MSDTPRTDAAVRDVDVAFVGHWGLSSEPQEFVSPEFTRELERDNTALRESRERLVRTASEVLEAFVLHKKVETGHPCPENMGICIDLRAAIDAARKEAKP